MKTLLLTHPVKDCAPSKTLVELRSQIPTPIATRHEGRVVSATQSARATPTAPVNSASRGWATGWICGVIPAKANASPDTKVLLYAMPTARTIARHGMGGFLSVIRLRVQASARIPLSYVWGERKLALAFRAIDAVRWIRSGWDCAALRGVAVEDRDTDACGSYPMKRQRRPFRD